GELHALFAQVLKIASELSIEEDDRFGAHETVLGAAEREHVDAQVASGLAQALAEGSGGIGDAGAVHVEKHFVFMGEAGQGFDFVRIVYGARLCGLVIEITRGWTWCWSPML